MVPHDAALWVWSRVAIDGNEYSWPLLSIGLNLISHTFSPLPLGNLLANWRLDDAAWKHWESEGLILIARIPSLPAGL
jgi:hypothetical protein